MTGAMVTGSVPGAEGGHYRFRHVARMEWIKLRSVRSTWMLLAFIVLAMVGVGIGVGVGYRSHTPVASAAQIVNNALGGAVLAQLLIGALGVLAVTGEYSSGMVRATFAAIPHRGLVLAAKVVIFGLVAFAVGELAAFAGLVAGQAAISGSPVPRVPLGDPFGAMFVPMFLGAMFGQAGIAVLKFVPLFILINSVAVVTPVPATLSAWAGIGVLCLYA